ncbi:MAG: DUF4440 domain-containing protein [Gemmatimonadetes bacterium]|nr:nuclear transport factor 2 family protein [Gemmatimonadota bacterium]NIR81448.1 nuclear transport factor 2 family protein [Gemmatimonadota bacterium]NIT90287.1 nuclear transport factor 2 family protein [Gemmatimonadota bacterium]NIU34113.1 nuclear transport factor 2 family protein [Gemmatimonadota bacterium]NIU38270.1 DUF4440 domain-containing protein [Gemmatimonadota bacterium]
MDFVRSGLTVGILTLLWGCAGGEGGGSPHGSEPAPELGTVEAQMDAFNDHDAPALAAGVTPDFAWFSVRGDSLAVETRGRDAFREGMEAYFASVAGVRSSIEATVELGRFVALRERVRWEDGSGETRSQAALGVYEVVDGQIRRVWYFTP